jgi:hypothetical protein
MSLKTFINHIVFGSRYRYQRKEQRLRILQKQSYFNFFSIIILSLTSILLSFLLYTQFYPLPSHLKVSYSDLNSSEKEMAGAVFNQVKGEYLLTQDTITFTKNLSNFYHPIFKSEKSRQEYLNDLMGYNHNENIYILFYPDQNYLKLVLCHELLHSFMYGSSEAHKIVYDLIRYYPCFENQTGGANDILPHHK